jgi:hypothetical protein
MPRGKRKKPVTEELIELSLARLLNIMRDGDMPVGVQLNTIKVVASVLDLKKRLVSSVSPEEVQDKIKAATEEIPDWLDWSPPNDD